MPKPGSRRRCENETRARRRKEERGSEYDCTSLFCQWNGREAPMSFDGASQTAINKQGQNFERKRTIPDMVKTGKHARRTNIGETRVRQNWE